MAAPCRDIQANPEKVFEHTNKANRIAVVSNGTRVLGLGNIGPEAGLPVMEGKALLFKHLGGVDTDAICVDTEDPDKFIEFCKMLQPSYGGFNLEDIKKPDCFVIERDNPEHFSWLPQSCAYRLRFENKPLPQWHPLLTGSRVAMIEAGIAVGHWCVSEEQVSEEELSERVIFTLKGEV